MFRMRTGAGMIAAALAVGSGTSVSAMRMKVKMEGGARDTQLQVTGPMSSSFTDQRPGPIDVDVLDDFTRYLADPGSPSGGSDGSEPATESTERLSTISPWGSGSEASAGTSAPTTSDPKMPNRNKRTMSEAVKGQGETSQSESAAKRAFR